MARRDVLPALGAGQERFRAEVCALLSGPEVAAEADASLRGAPAEEPGLLEVYRRLGERGWLAPNWPPEYGGLGRTIVEKTIVTEELVLHGVPSVVHTLAVDIVGLFLLAEGTEAQRRRYLPPLARGEQAACVLFSEPEAGSDLAALSTRAEPDGDGWRLHGRKVFNMKSHLADFGLCAARTSEAGVRYHGITLFIVPMRTPGVAVRPLWSIADERFGDVTLQGIRLTRDHVVGEVDGGWDLLGRMLRLERTGVEFAAKARAWLDVLLRAAADGGHLEGLHGPRLVALDAEVRAARLLAWSVVEQLRDGEPDDVSAAVAKLWSSEAGTAVARAGVEVLGLDAVLARGDAAAPAAGAPEAAYREAPGLTLASGTSEVMLSLVATVGLGLSGGGGARRRAEHLRLTKAQREVAERFAELFDSEFVPELRRLAEHPAGPAGLAPDSDGEDARRAVWAALVDLGALRLGIPAEHGGLGLGQAEMAVLCEQMGTALLPSPFFDTTTAADLLLRTGLDGAGGEEDVLARIAGGATVALAARDGAAAGTAVPGPVDPGQGRRSVRCTRAFVAFAAEADYLLVAGREGGELLLGLVPREHPAVGLERHDEVGRGDLYRVTLAQAPLLGGALVPCPGRDWEGALAAARIRHAAYLAGLSRGALDLALAHARERRQHGQPIGHFQAVAFRLARLAGRIEASRHLTHAAAGEADRGADARLPAAQALAAAASLARDVTVAAMQVHGAAGMTEDSDAQRFYRRAAVDAVWLGTPAQVLHGAAGLLAARVAAERAAPGGHA